MSVVPNGMRKKRISSQGFTRGMTRRLFNFVACTNTATLIDSRRTCGRRSRRRCNCPGAQQKQCTGRSAKWKWRSAPMCLSSTLQANLHRNRFWVSQIARIAPLLRQERARHQRSPTRTRITTVCRRFRCLRSLRARRRRIHHHGDEGTAWDRRLRLHHL